MRRSVLNSPNTNLEIEKAMHAKLVAEALSGSDASSSSKLQRSSTVSEPKAKVAVTGEREDSGGRPGSDTAFRGQWTAILPHPTSSGAKQGDNAEHYRIGSFSPREVQDSRGRVQFHDRRGRYTSAPRVDIQGPSRLPSAQVHPDGVGSVDGDDGSGVGGFE